MSTPPLQALRGTHDLLPADFRRHYFVVEQARAMAQLFGFVSIDTPIIESSAVFHKTLGEVTDIIGKEMYVFNDRGGNEIVLRPEGTAGVARAFINHHLDQPCKVFYAGPYFRYKRPQKGRQRQFHHVGVEWLGDASPVADVEAIILAYQFLDRLGLGQMVTLEINTLGNDHERQRYRQHLTTYLLQYQTELSAESQTRLVQNPLRILDSKSSQDQAIIAGAPRLLDTLDDESRDRFAQVQSLLKALNIPFKINTQLVRGLDYYTHTIFEFTTPHLGTQSTVLAGGRYGQLIATMGGPATPGVGWAAGVERLCLLVDTERLPTPIAPVWVVPLSPTEIEPALMLAQKLRMHDISVEVSIAGALSKRLKKAAQREIRFVLIIGDQEINTETVVMRDLMKSTQQTYAQTEIVAVLENERK